MRRMARPPFETTELLFLPLYGGFTPSDRSALRIEDVRDVGVWVEREMQQEDHEAGHDDVADGPGQAWPERPRPPARLQPLREVVHAAKQRRKRRIGPAEERVQARRDEPPNGEQAVEDVGRLVAVPLVEPEVGGPRRDGDQDERADSGD